MGAFAALLPVERLRSSQHNDAMQAAAVEILAEAQLPSAQALAITKAMELEVNASIETLATKTQLAEVRTELKADILDLRNELARAEARFMRTVLALFVAQTATLLGGVYVMIHS